MRLAMLLLTSCIGAEAAGPSLYHRWAECHSECWPFAPWDPDSPYALSGICLCNTQVVAPLWAQEHLRGESRCED